MNPYFIVVIPAILVAFLHCAHLDHWMPYVITARAKRWRDRTIMLLALSGSLAHLVGTTLVGAVLILCGEGLKLVFAKDAPRVVGGLVALAGLWFLYRGMLILRRRETHTQHCGHHERTLLVKDDGVQRNGGGTFFLGALGGLRPCWAAMGFFLEASSYPLSISIITFLGWAFASVIGMVGLVWLGTLRLEKLKIDKLERYNELITGFIIMAMGICSVFSPN